MTDIHVTFKKHEIGELVYEFDAQVEYLDPDNVLRELQNFCRTIDITEDYDVAVSVDTRGDVFRGVLYKDGNWSGLWIN